MCKLNSLNQHICGNIKYVSSQPIDYATLILSHVLEIKY